MNIAEKILEILDWYGMEQKQLAKKADLPYTTLHGYLKQDKSIPADAIIKIAKALDLSVSTFLNSEPLSIKPIELTEEESKMVGVFRSLSGKQKKFILQSIRLFHEENQS